MSAIAFDETFDTTTELVRARVERGDRQLEKLAPRSSLMGRLAEKLFFHFEQFLVGYLDKKALTFKDHAIWFKGVARDMTDQGYDPTVANAALLPRLDKFKADLLTGRTHMLELRNTEQAGIEVRQAAQRAANGLAELFEAVEGLRWCLLELEADHAQRDEGWTADSPEAVTELFARLKQTA